MRLMSDTWTFIIPSSKFNSLKTDKYKIEKQKKPLQQL